MIDIFMIDPPWPRKKGGLRKVRPDQGRLLDYDTMSVLEIFHLLDKDIFSQAACIHTVFLWSIDKYLIESELQMIRRDYKLHARFVWDKGNGVAPAFTVRYSHEYLSWFYKPNMIPIAIEQRGHYTTVINEPSREHSRKPDKAYKMIDNLYPTHRKLDVFSREKRKDWQQYGNEIDKF